MRPLDVRRVGAPASCFEGGGVDEAFVDCEESFADTIRNVIEVACSQLVRHKAAMSRLVGQSRHQGKQTGHLTLLPE